MAYALAIYCLLFTGLACDSCALHGVLTDEIWFVLWFDVIFCLHFLGIVAEILSSFRPAGGGVLGGRRAGRDALQFPFPHLQEFSFVTGRLPRPSQSFISLWAAGRQWISPFLKRGSKMAPKKGLSRVSLWPKNRFFATFLPFLPLLFSL